MLKLVLHPDKRLKTVCKAVSKEAFGSPELIEQVNAMIETMYGYAGIGLAANQVGFDNRVVIVAKDPKSYPRTTPLVLINPAIQTRSDKKQTMREGCLSFPTQTTMRRRSASVRIKAFDMHGKEFSWLAKGLAAQCIQHEIDHLNGKTFLDR